jgi:hypothetical protein
MSAPEPTKKKFGSGERTIPHHTEKAPKYYPAEDVAQPKKVGNSPFTRAWQIVGGMVADAFRVWGLAFPTLLSKSTHGQEEAEM